MQTGIALGLMAALFWGVADFCARGASRAAGTFATLLVVQVLGIAGLLAFGLPLGVLRLAGVPMNLTLAAAAINLLIMGGAALLYRAFAVGTLALVSPIAASFAAITALLALLSGERPSPQALVGIGLTIAGVVVVSAVPEATAELEKEATALAHRRWRPARGLVEALGAMLTFGVGYWLLRFVTDPLGGVTVAFIGKLADFAVLVVVALVLLVRRDLSGRGATQTSHPAAFWLYVVPTGLLDTAANVAYNLGITVALTSVVVVLASLFSAVTVGLAWIFLRERLAPWQRAGVGAILIGIVLVNL